MPGVMADRFITLTIRQVTLNFLVECNSGFLGLFLTVVAMVRRFSANVAEVALVQPENEISILEYLTVL